MFSIARRPGLPAEISRSARSALPSTATSRLLKSCARPPASTPRLSARCASTMRRSSARARRDVDRRADRADDRAGRVAIRRRAIVVDGLAAVLGLEREDSPPSARWCVAITSSADRVVGRSPRAASCRRRSSAGISEHLLDRAAGVAGCAGRDRRSSTTPASAGRPGRGSARWLRAARPRCASISVRSITVASNSSPCVALDRRDRRAARSATRPVRVFQCTRRPSTKPLSRTPRARGARSLGVDIDIADQVEREDLLDAVVAEHRDERGIGVRAAVRSRRAIHPDRRPVEESQQLGYRCGTWDDRL